MKKHSQSPRTIALHGQYHSKAWDFKHHLIPPMTASTTFRLESLKRGAQGFSNFASEKNTHNDSHILIYDRLDEPNSLMLEEQLSALHGGEMALVFGSGMGAISTLFLAFTQKNQKIISHRTLYGCTYSLLKNWLPRLGIQTQFEDVSAPDFLKNLSDKSLRILYFETLSNPLLEMIDLETLIAAVKIENLSRNEENKILIAVDNTFATPWALRPLEYGVDFVIESLTKNISGFGTEMGGAIIASKKYESPLKIARKDFGGIMTSHSAWHIMVYGVSTQALRFEKQQENAMKIAHFLNIHPKVERVIYPGLENFKFHQLAKKYLKTPEGNFAPGTMLAFRLKGTPQQTETFVDDVAKNSYAITLAVSLGLTKTLIEIPGYMTHSAMSDDDKKSTEIDAKLIRLSVGLENINDLISDLSSSLEKI